MDKENGKKRLIRGFTFSFLMQSTVKKVSMYVHLSVCTYVQFPNLPLQTKLCTENTTADIILGVKSKLDIFTP